MWERMRRVRTSEVRYLQDDANVGRDTEALTTRERQELVIVEHTTETNSEQEPHNKSQKS